jgi:hypothetical protein
MKDWDRQFANLEINVQSDAYIMESAFCPFSVGKLVSCIFELVTEFIKGFWYTALAVK